MGIKKDAKQAEPVPSAPTRPLRAIVAAWLTGANDAALGTLAADAAAATAPVESAEREHVEAARRLGDARAELAAAEQAFDDDPITEKGSTVIETRHTRDLVALRAERAAKRLDDARAAREKASNALERARLQAAGDAVRTLETTALDQLDKARAANRARFVGALAQIEAFLVRADEQARAAVAPIRGELAEVPVALRELEDRLLAVAPALAGDVALEREFRAERTRAAALREASLEAFDEEIADAAAGLVLFERLAVEFKARIRAAMSAQREAERAARELGAEPPHVEDACLFAHVEHARFLGTPPAQRDAKKHAEALWKALDMSRVIAGKDLADDEKIRLCMAATSPGDLYRTVLSIQRDKDASTGDVNEALRRKHEGVMLDPGERWQLIDVEPKKATDTAALHKEQSQVNGIERAAEPL